jgi:hypothetical protein
MMKTDVPLVARLTNLQWLRRGNERRCREKGAGSTKARWNKKAVRGKEANEVRLVGSGKTRQIAF